jgi:V/A-type H+-transporting ATPase subunit A
MLALGVPVQRLLALPLLARARRCKTLFTNDQATELNASLDEIAAAFDALRIEYSKPTGAAKP